MALTKIDDRGLKTPIDLLDDEKIRFGTGNDLDIYHDGTQNLIEGTAPLYIKGSPVVLYKGGTTEKFFEGVADAEVKLYYDGTKKFETSSAGVKITGELEFLTASDVNFTGSNYHAVWDASASALELKDSTKLIFGTGDDLQIYHSSNNIFDSKGKNTQFRNIDTDGTATDSMLSMVPNGGVYLYYDGVLQLNTTSTGVTLGDNKRIDFGDGADLRIYHESSSTTNWLEATNGDTKIQCTDGDIYLNPKAGEVGVKAITDGAVELYYNGTSHMKTTGEGIDVHNVDDAVLTITTTGTDAHDDARLELITQESAFKIQNDRSLGTDGGLTFKAESDNGITIFKDGAVDLYYDNVKKLETTSGGVAMGTTAHITSYNSSGNKLTIHAGNSSGGTLELSAVSNADAYNAGMLLFYNDANSNATQFQADSKLVGIFRAEIVTTDSNAGDDSGADFAFYTKPEAAAAAESMRIHGEGYVTKPKQPSFVARAGAARDNVTGAVTFTSCDSGWNVSGSYDTSNSRFTAPVAGWYHFGGQSGYKETGDNYNIKFMVNGAYQFEVARVIGGSDDDSWISHSSWAWSQIYKLAKDDYVEINTAYELHQNSTYSNFWGYLIK